MKKVALSGIILFVFSTTLCFASTHSPVSLKDTDKVCSIEDYGAVGDGKVINTKAINKAISACANNGGGTVLIPEGKYVSGTILLKSNITLYLEDNATILGINDVQQYQSFNLKPGDPSRPIHIRNNPVWFRALILLDNVHNVTITGFGTINGNSVVDKQGEEGWRGPHGILIGDSRNIKISNIRVTRSGNYNILGLDVEDIELTNLTITEGSDGIHIRRGKDILIENCKIYTSDDAIAGGYWDNVVISDCLINSSCNGIRLIFPATNLEIKDSEISGPGIFGHRRGSFGNSLETNSLTGIILQPGAWGYGPGKLDQISIHNIRIRDFQTALTFVLNEGNRAGSVDIKNVVATGIYRNACSIEAWSGESKFETVSFKDVSITYHVRNEQVLNVTGIKRPKTESRPLPFWGLYARGVKSISFENTRFDYVGKEIRPVMGFESVNEVLFNGVKYKAVADTEPIKYFGNPHLKSNSFEAFE